MSRGSASNSGSLGRSDAISARLTKNWSALALRGILAILFGIIAFLLPGVTIAWLVVLVAAYMLADGVLAIVAGLRPGRRRERWSLLVLKGTADIVTGAIALLPAITVVLFVVILAAWALVSGF